MNRVLTIKQAINETLFEEFRRDPTIIIMGCDVGHRGNPFGLTKGLYDEFGPERVLDTPISEAAIIGTCLGAAATGLRPIGEILFSDWITIGMDQLVNQVAKIRYMFGGKINVPMVIRAPVGAGGGQAAQHSQSFESWFSHVPGLQVVMPITPYDVKGLLKTSLRGNDPVLFFEHKRGYEIQGEVPDEDYTIPFGQAKVCREGKDVTIVAISIMLHKALAVAKQLSEVGIECEVIDPRTIYPFDYATIIRSLSKTHRLVVTHEANRRSGIGGEIVSQIVERAFDQLDAKPVIVAGLDVPMPYNKKLEAMVIPSEEKLNKAILELMDQ
ncbi:MAG TPA: alpha-ketoacid dehydrogenase subunit beta [Anaerolineaceae bacterium]|nr:alpha-ketoacid dehydrogenase subunit beta [Anaerolineaceae bacterium]